MTSLQVIAFDADDTLWHNERLYVEAQAKLVQVLDHYHSPELIGERLYQAETRNIQLYGYGIKAFALSMIETALNLSEGRIPGKDMQALIDQTRAMLSADIQLFAHTAEVIPLLASRYPLVLITKGDLFEQEGKIKRSGFGSYFQHIEILSHKTPASYEQVFKRYSVEPARFMMVGNSLRSDILPILELGGQAVYIPCDLTWTHETADPPPADRPGYYQLEHLGQLPALLEQLEQQGNDTL
ncbi:MAG TPA: HAD family hydrolase [Anaerolineales bacterium]|nr:HAD family hydrolase [Anaerolineales bacterium]